MKTWFYTNLQLYVYQLISLSAAPQLPMISFNSPSSTSLPTSTFMCDPKKRLIVCPQKLSEPSTDPNRKLTSFITRHSSTNASIPISSVVKSAMTSLNLISSSAYDA